MQGTYEFIKKLWSDIPPEGENEVIELKGKCHDCGAEVSLFLNRECAVVKGEGGFWHFPFGSFFKCGECFEKDNTLRNYQPCEVYSRVVGYLRPVQQWNKGKQEEFKERTNFKVE